MADTSNAFKSNIKDYLHQRYLEIECVEIFTLWSINNKLFGLLKLASEDNQYIQVHFIKIRAYIICLQNHNRTHERKKMSANMKHIQISNFEN